MRKYILAVLLFIAVFLITLGIHPKDTKPPVLVGDYNGVTYVAYRKDADVDVELFKLYKASGLTPFKYEMIGEGDLYKADDGQYWIILRLDQVPLVFNKRAERCLQWEVLNMNRKKIIDNLK